MSKLTIGLLLGSTREGRMCDRVATFVKMTVEKDHTVVMFGKDECVDKVATLPREPKRRIIIVLQENHDPLEMEFPLTQRAMNPSFNPPTPVSDRVRRQNDMVANCDALIVVTPEYVWSAPPALANIVTNMTAATAMWKPCAIVSYSVSPLGGWVGAMQVRQLLGGIGCILTQKQMGVPMVHESLDSEGHPAGEKLQQELHTTLSQLYWLTRAINNHKAVEEAPSFSL